MTKALSLILFTAVAASAQMDMRPSAKMTDAQKDRGCVARRARIRDQGRDH
jgi:hypothetical protein